MLGIAKRNKAEIIVVLIFMLYALGYNIYRVQGDGLYYYAFLERMLNIPNPESSLFKLEQTYFFKQSGCSYFNLPFYLAAYLIEKKFNLNLNFNGITLRQISINLASNFYMVLSLILIVKTLKYLKVKYIIFSVISILVSTSALTVAVIMPSSPHTVDIFFMTLFVYLLVRNHENNPFKSIWLGMVNIIAVLIRYFNFLLIIPALSYLLCLKKYKNLKFMLIGLIGFGWIIPLLLYIYNGTISPFYKSGMAIATTALAKSKPLLIPLIPQYLLRLLVHPLHGLFVWAPVTIFSAIGLIFAPKDKEKLGYLFLGIWFSFLFLYGFISFWNAGWSFTNRYVVNLFPIYIIGLALFCDRYGKKTFWFLILLTLYSVILFLNWHLCIMNAEFGTPGDAIQAWIKGESSTFICKMVNLKVFITRLWEMCRYKYLLRFFFK